MDEKELIYEGIETAFIDYNNQSNTAYKPQFISNDYKEGRKVISSIEDELLKCDRFDISVAFITDGGIAPLLQIFKILFLKHFSKRYKKTAKFAVFLIFT